MGLKYQLIYYFYKLFINTYIFKCYICKLIIHTFCYLQKVTFSYFSNFGMLLLLLLLLLLLKYIFNFCKELLFNRLN